MIDSIPVAPRAFVWAALLVVAAPTLLIAFCAYMATGNVLGAQARVPVLLAYVVTAALGLLLLADLRMNSVAIREDGQMTLRGGAFLPTDVRAERDRSALDSPAPAGSHA